MSNKYEENVIQDEIYQVPGNVKLKIVILSLILALTGLFMNLPMLGNLEDRIETAIKSNPACPVTYKNLKLSYFMPGLDITKPVIPGVCFNNPAKKLKLDSINTNFVMPSFVPPGIKLHSEIKGMNSIINLYPRISAGAVDVRITKSKINAKLINSLTNYPNLLGGVFDLEGFVSLKGENLESGVAKLSSKNLNIPAQTINFFNIPDMPLKKLNLVVKIEKNKININQLLIGSEDSPIVAELKGNITLNQRAINFSLLNLEGKIKFSPEFLKTFSILEMMLGKAKPVDGYYNFALNGTLAAPKPVFK
jgi:type II secretion system protein N